jgi:LysM repeat protein
VHYQCTMQAAFLVSVTCAGRSPLGSPANSTSSPIKRILPYAAAPAALAGLAAAALAIGNSSGGASAVADASAHHPAPTAATPQASASSTPLVSLTKQPATGLPVVRLDATKLAAMEPKGKHHRATPVNYVVKSGDTLASIAQHLYHSADYWPVLYWANHGKIKYASEITAGQLLAVPAKPAKIPGAPKELAPAPAPAPVAASSASSGQGYSSAGTTQAAPVQAASTYSGSGGFQACVIAAESGGNSQVMNSSGHYGLYQFSASTWAAYGGNPADFGNASVAEQNQVFNSAIAAGGQSNWAPYDGC